MTDEINTKNSLIKFVNKMPNCKLSGLIFSIFVILILEMFNYYTIEFPYVFLVFSFIVVYTTIYTGLQYGIISILLLISYFVFRKVSEPNFYTYFYVFLNTIILLSIAFIINHMQKRFNLYIQNQQKSYEELQDQLSVNEYKFKELFNNMGTGCAIYDVVGDGQDFIFKDFNSSAERIYKIDKEDIVGKSLKEYFPELYKYGLLDMFQTAWRTEEPQYIPSFEHKSEKYSIWRNSYVYKLPSGELVSIFDDITQSKLALEELKESKKRYQYLFENSPHSIFVFNFVNKEARILFANPSGLNLIGVQKEHELYGKPLLDIIHPDYHNIVKQRIKKVRTGGQVVPLIEEKFVRMDGSSVDVEVTSTSFPYNGEILVQVVARDITEKKRAEELKIKAEENKKLLHEAIEYDRLKTEFFSNISHELRTPLNLITSTLQLLEMHLQDIIMHDEENKVDRQITVIRQNCYRLLRLVGNLIDVTKMDSDFFNLKLQNKDIVGLIDEIIQSVMEYVQAKSINLEFNTEVSEKIIACDPDAIERIILNLISNAIKFTHSQGNITVSIRDKGSNIQISVQDDGIGIPEEKKETIFERFMQIDKSFTRKHEGSGIGLSLVKLLVEMHGGSITVNSEENKGSEFIIEFPVRTISAKDDYTSEDNSAQQLNIQERRDIEFSDIC